MRRKDEELAREQKALRQVRAELENERKERQDERDCFESQLARLREEVRRAGRRKVSLEMGAESELKVQLRSGRAGLRALG